MTRRLAVVLMAATLALVGCTKTQTPSAAHPTTAGPVTGEITVFAAASLTESFTTIGHDFEAANPGSKVDFSFLGSSTLAQQINSGAPADVFASASPTNMKQITDAGNGDGTPVVFAHNQLVIVVPKGNPQQIHSLADLTRPGLKVVLCAQQVPCGAAARTALDAASQPLKPVSYETDVKAALAKVTSGNADAALVYRTDANSAKASVEGIEFPESAMVINDYPIVALKGSTNKPAAAAFVAYVLSDRGIAVLTGVGFQRP